jgi:phenylalanyl-tRNA synthetase beta chain
MYRSGLEGTREIELGTLGILHPSVLMNFEIPYPCSALEFNLEPFLKEGKEPWE